ncbi:MAG: ATP-binding cassette domain-containing protein [Bacteroidetes bacterium]|nr:ATP-binding cassette domain-containing protein [Bacteroidota bacterium]
MSEEILKALMQLFAIIAKQDDGVEANEIAYVKTFLTQQLNAETVEEYLDFFYKYAGIDKNQDISEQKNNNKKKLTSVKDSVRILGICKKINKKLNQQQKAVVLVRVFELVNADRKFTDQRVAIINTVAEVFNMPNEEFKSVEAFVIENETDKLDASSILIINDNQDRYQNSKHIQTEALDKNIFILQIKSVDLYFLKYTGSQEIFLNGLPINNKRIYLFANGSSIRLPKGKPVYYSDVVSHFLSDITSVKISYNVNNVEFRFPNGAVGLRDINISEKQGELVGIMGASGAGKTTLLNVLTGMEAPSKGEVLINGVNLHTEEEKMEGVIGYIPQDDLLVEELTVYQNLYFNAKLCFKNITNDEIIELVDKTLANLGLLELKDLKVGSPLNKSISGGQRKRLNIALELIREPPILFVDEPTSGLSSRDSEHVMDLLRELALKGKLIFVVIHQPSSDIYKMFDKMIIVDTGGYLIYNGNPVEAVKYFKQADAQINSEVGECATCGNVNPELIFNIIDAEVVDEFGKYSGKRKVSPPEWQDHYQKNKKDGKKEDEKEAPPKSLNIPNWFSQFRIYTLRDILSKITDKQYVFINLLEAPLLAFMLAFTVKYIVDPNSNLFIFRENENIPPYIFMCIITALFLGFMVSAEEIFKDRKILKREAFLNLSRSSYLMSKVVILLAISAIQSILFVLVGNYILDIRGMIFVYWFAIFATSAFSSMMGLIVSSSFDSAVTIYILFPLLIIPHMVLGGAMFSFNKLNKVVGSSDKVPMFAEMIAARWAYEALSVYQFKDNEFEKQFYELEKQISVSDFKQVYYIPELKDIIDDCVEGIKSNNDSIRNVTENNFELLRNELSTEQKNVKTIKFDFINKLYIDSFSNFIAINTSDYLDKLLGHYTKQFSVASSRKEKTIDYLDDVKPGYYNKRRNAYHNEALSNLVKKIYEKNQIIRIKNHLVQQIDPIYQDPSVNNFFDARAHFYAPRKHFMGMYFDTYWFDISVIWLMSLLLYIVLYYNLLRKALNIFSK